ncbi:5-amino-6-(5-phosphoribosylamino)uracil reductase [Neorhizobium lilium]|uniref:5-amino-6-(5-phosphoribosylamino)uracil reductase n=1 Tax=Neorhizobium lilium TaxID=2503024 RepID=A0A3S3RGC2_9HYPH|nr:dihydrofolate reductase family protein [Neorhizobium lilium]RWX77077.1 5-amino-6-(5-phosphoribosylamino)uracil reductase [Neorhizobium lilium]
MRPRIICHMTSSVDGRQLLDRWTKPASGIEPAILSGHYNEIYKRLDTAGWIVGRKTMSYYAEERAPETATPEVHPAGPRENHFADRRGRALAVGVDLQGKLHYDKDNAEGDHIVAILGPGVSDSYLAELHSIGVSYVFAKDREMGLGHALEAIGEAFQVERLCLQGGGTINGAFLKAGLINEISLLVYPGIDGLSGIPSIFEYLGGPDEKPAAGKSLRHVLTETLEGGTVWLRYLVEQEPAA